MHPSEAPEGAERRAGAGEDLFAKMQTQFTTREAYDAQRLLQDLILTPRDPLQHNAQTLLNKYNMHPDNARTLADQKVTAAPKES